MNIEELEYGRVRRYRNVPPKNMEYLFCTTSVGWQQTNDTYYVDRPNGSIDSTIVLTISGEGVFEYNGQKYVMAPGDICIVPPNSPHIYYPAENKEWEFYWIHILNNHATSFINKIVEDNEPVFPCDDAKRIIDLTERLIACGDDTSNDTSVDESRIISDIVHTLLKYETKDIFKNQRAKYILDGAMQYIEKHYAENIKISDLCEKLYISQTHLIRLFNKYFDMTPHQYIEQFRLKKSLVLLAHTYMSIEDIAHRVGYGSPSNFILKFKKMYEITPQQYRKKEAFK